MNDRRRFVRFGINERRRFLRFSITLKAIIELEVNGESPSQARILEFSREGLRLFIPKVNLFDKQSLKLRIYMPGATLPVLLKGSVKWMKQKEEGWELGAKIEDVNSEAKSEILEYAYKLWKEEKA
ncbi:MAG: PilZ domain-containing protein [Candidatus Omnitrophica bacterium]|nr:PilZ domain-containing protein [Candidatus Omnitrophota bacterium]